MEFIEDGIEYYYELDIKDSEISREALWKKTKPEERFLKDIIMK